MQGHLASLDAGDCCPARGVARFLGNFVEETVASVGTGFFLVDRTRALERALDLCRFQAAAHFEVLGNRDVQGRLFRVVLMARKIRLVVQDPLARRWHSWALLEALHFLVQSLIVDCQSFD